VLVRKDERDAGTRPAGAADAVNVCLAVRVGPPSQARSRLLGAAQMCLDFVQRQFVTAADAILCAVDQ
jgi:hypothetical protein